jgi:hypothetical protein
MDEVHERSDSVDFYNLTEELHPVSQNNKYVSLWNYFRFVLSCKTELIGSHKGTTIKGG